MIELYKYIQEGILGDIDDTLNTADENTDRYLIASWLNENIDFVSMFANRVSSFTASSKMRINSKNEFDVYEFKPLNAYSSSNKQKLDLPVPEYIKFNSANTISITGHDIDKLNMKLLPHFNISCSGRKSSAVIKAAKTLFKDFDTFKTYALKNIKRPI